MKSISLFIDQQLTESWAYFPRTIYVHKLVNPTGRHTLDSIDVLVKLGVVHNPKNIHIYSFIHPDSNILISITGPDMLKPGAKYKAWNTYVNPMRGYLYKGSGIGASAGTGPGQGMNAFSSEMIQRSKFSSSSFLFTGETNTFQKVGEIPCEAISTSFPIPLPYLIGFLTYENMKFECDKNKYGIEGIQFKKIKVMSLPQILTKANYMFVYECIVT